MGTRTLTFKTSASSPSMKFFTMDFLLGMKFEWRLFRAGRTSCASLPEARVSGLSSLEARL